MSGLMELGPMTRDVEIMGSKLTLRPISTREIILLLSKFPQIAELFGSDREVATIEIGPEALAHIVACSTGELHNPEAIEAATRLGLGKIMEILDVVMEITFEDGVDPFMVRVKKMLGVVSPLSAIADLGQESSTPWSASLVGDEPRKPRLARARAN